MDCVDLFAHPIRPFGQSLNKVRPRDGCYRRIVGKDRTFLSLVRVGYFMTPESRDLEFFTGVEEGGEQSGSEVRRGQEEMAASSQDAAP